MEGPTRFAEETAAALSMIDASALEQIELTIEQRIVEGTDVLHRYAVVIANGQAKVVEEDVEADIVISQDLATAEALQSGSRHAQTSYLTGKLTIDGDVDKLLEHGPALQAVVEAMQRPRTSNDA